MKKVLWVMNTIDKTGYYMSPALIWWYGILPNIDPDYKVLDPIQILKEKHGDYYYE